MNLVDVWDPGEVLRLMVTEGLGMGGGATFFLTSLLDHPDFTDEHLALMPFAGLGGSSVPSAVTERAAGLGITAFRSYGSTEHPSITGCLLDDPEAKRLHTDGHALPGVEIRLDDHGEISSRGPDCFVGYTDPALTASVFDADGWYRTGDVGVLDDDGYLTITDRVSRHHHPRRREHQRPGGRGAADRASTAWPRSASSPRPTIASASTPPPSSASARAPACRPSTTCAPTWPRPGWPSRSGPSRSTRCDLPRTPSGKVQKYRLRQSLRDGEPWK